MSNDIVIKVENLSKLYRLGELHKQTGSFREKVTQSFKRLVLRGNDGKPPPYGSRSLPSSSKSDSKSLNPLNSFNSLNRPAQQTPDSIWALKDVSFEVRRGEVLGIIGRNGAGKSTLLKILSRITKPTNGKAWINGRVGSLLEVGTGFHAELTGRENIYLNGAILGMRKAEIKRKFDEILQFSELEKFVDTPVKRYSSDMYVRLAFAVAAHLDPEILLIDEVLAVGDASFQKKCLGKMDDATEKGKTVLFVSHNIPAIMKICQKAIWLQNGEIQQIGNSQETISQYIDRIENPSANNTKSPAADHPVLTLKNLYFTKDNGQKISCLATGDSFQIHWVISSLTTLSDVVLSIGIYDDLDRLLCVMDSGVVNRTFTIRHGQNRIKCIVDQLPLSSGIYKINAAIKIDNKLLQGYEGRSIINVYENDFSRKHKSQKRGYFFIKHSWVKDKKAE